MGYFDFWEYFGPCQLIDFMRKIVGSSIGLDGKLKLWNYLFIDGDLESDVTNRLRICEPALYFRDPVSSFRIFLHKLFDFVQC